MPRQGESGVVLINVQVILALASAVVVAMIRLSDDAIASSRAYRDAGQALALVAGGEATAIAALRRDLREAPETDHRNEAWAAIDQQTVAIEGGTFALTLTDAQARFNLNGLAEAGVLGMQILQRIVALLDLPADLAPRIAARAAQAPALTQLADLADIGIDHETLRALSDYVTVLPSPTGMNINTVPDAMFSVVTDNPVQARILQGIRSRQGRLEAQDLARAQVILPPGVGFRSQYFLVNTLVTIGDVAVSRESLLQRLSEPGRPATVVVIARRATGH